MPVFVYVARDSLILDSAVKAHIPAGVNCSRYSASDLDANRIFEHLGIPDLFSDKQLFHYTGIAALKLRKNEADQVEALLKGLPENITLVCSELVAEESRSREERKLQAAEIQRFARHGEFSDLRPLSEGRNAVDWLLRYAVDTHGLKFNRSQMERLFEACGDNVALAGMELAKFDLMKSADNLVPISDNLLDQALSTSPHARFYDVLDSILSGAPDSLSKLHDWFDATPDTFRLIVEISRRLMAVKQAREGKPVQPAFFARQAKALANKLTGPKLDLAIANCAALEHGLKSGQFQGETREKGELAALELFCTGINA